MCRIDLTITGTAEDDAEEFFVQLNARIEKGHIRANNPLGAYIVFSIIVVLLLGLFVFALRKRKKKEATTPPNR